MLLLTTLLAVAAFGDVVRIKGSDTMLRIDRALASEYQKKSKDRLVMSGGGTEVGIAALFAQSADLVAISRPITRSESAALQKKGIAIQCTSIAKDGITIGVQPAMSLHSLTFSQLRDIYTGETRNWKQLGGPDLTIVPFSLDEYSGTRTLFQDNILKGAAFGPAVQFVPSTQEELRMLERQPGGIVYGGMGYITGSAEVRPIPLSPQRGKPAVPISLDTVRSGSYPLTRELCFVTCGIPSPATRRFLDWSLSRAGQRCIQSAGFCPVK